MQMSNYIKAFSNHQSALRISIFTRREFTWLHPFNIWSSRHTHLCLRYIRILLEENAHKYCFASSLRRVSDDKYIQNKKIKILLLRNKGFLLCLHSIFPCSAMSDCRLVYRSSPAFDIVHRSSVRFASVRYDHPVSWTPPRPEEEKWLKCVQ